MLHARTLSPAIAGDVTTVIVDTLHALIGDTYAVNGILRSTALMKPSALLLLSAGQ
jgi:hypothetical protein